MQHWCVFLAHGVVILHLAFVLFVAFGGLFVLWRKGWAWIHVPCALWGAWVEFAGWVCPLTPLENRLRVLAGLETYSGDFLGRYVLPVLYPEGLTRTVQILWGAAVLFGNAGLYSWAFRKRRSYFARKST